jgi:hypothetical protein
MRNLFRVIEIVWRCGGNTYITRRVQGEAKRWRFVIHTMEFTQRGRFATPTLTSIPGSIFVSRKEAGMCKFRTVDLINLPCLHVRDGRSPPLTLDTGNFFWL